MQRAPASDSEIIQIFPQKKELTAPGHFQLNYEKGVKDEALAPENKLANQV